MIFMNKLMLGSSSSSLYHKRIASVESKKQSYSIKQQQLINLYLQAHKNNSGQQLTMQYLHLTKCIKQCYSIPNYKTFQLFQIRSFCYAHRCIHYVQIHTKNNVSRKDKTSYNLEQREYLIFQIHPSKKPAQQICIYDSELCYLILLSRN